MPKNIVRFVIRAFSLALVLSGIWFLLQMSSQTSITKDSETRKPPNIQIHGNDDRKGKQLNQRQNRDRKNTKTYYK